MDYNTFKEQSGKVRNEYASSLQKMIDEQSKLYRALCLKWDKAASDADSEPKIVAQLGEQANEVNRKLKELEQKQNELANMCKQLEAEEKNVVAAHIVKREAVDGRILCGSGTINIRPSGNELPKTLKLYKDIVEENRERKSKRHSNSNNEIVKAVLEQLKEIQNKK